MLFCTTFGKFMSENRRVSALKPNKMMFSCVKNLRAIGSRARVLGLLLAAAIVSATLTPLSAAEYGQQKFQYTIASAGTGANGTFLYTVECDVKKVDMAEAALGRNAIHGVIFKGCEPANRQPKQTPLVKSPTLDEVQVLFFDAFFEQRTYQQFVTSIARNSMVIIKAKKGYHIKAVVSVDKRKLRQHLEAHQIIESLTAPF